MGRQDDVADALGVTTPEEMHLISVTGRAAALDEVGGGLEGAGGRTRALATCSFGSDSGTTTFSRGIRTAFWRLDVFDVNNALCFF